MGLFPAGSIHPRHLALRVVRRRNMVVTWPASVVFGAFDRRQRIDLYYRDSNPAHEAEVVSRTGAVTMAYRVQWKLVLLYVVVAAIVYAVIYYLFFAAPPTVPAGSGGGGGLYP